ncbi:MAG: hypothetical protein OXT67_02050 [Zetaproteobacteria bacterium]|nr:hypothetical protein [Zetaproteobacteria bacterium]
MKKQLCQQMLDKSIEELRTPRHWLPHLCFLSFGLVLLFIGHILLGLNPRIGNPAIVLPLKAEHIEDGPLWLSVSLHQESLVVTTAERNIMRFPALIQSQEELTPLKNYIRRHLVGQILSAGLTKKVRKKELFVLIAVDQKAKYVHLRPVLQLLAELGISQYGFETQIPLDTVTAPQGNTPTEATM